MRIEGRGIEKISREKREKKEKKLKRRKFAIILKYDILPQLT